MNAVPAIRLVESKPTDFVDSWLSSLSAKTERAYRGDIQQFFDFIGHDDVTKITRADCHAYQGMILDNYSKPATANRKLTVMRCLLTEAVRYGIIPASPAEGIRGQKRDSYSPTKAPSSDQIKAVFDAIGEDSLIDLRDRAMLAVAAQMGLRREEIANLTTECIGETEGRVVLDVNGKGNKTRRMVIPKSALESILKWLAIARISSGPIFQPIHKGKAAGRSLEPSTVYYIVCRRLQAGGVEGCSTHSLRHYNITRLFAKGADLYKVQRWAGHADPRTTQGYNRAQDDIQNSPADLLEEE